MMDLVGLALVAFGSGGLVVTWLATIMGGGPVVMVVYGSPSLMMLSVGIWFTL